MSEALAWLLYLVAGALAFAGVYRLRWPITISMLAATAVTMLVWYAAVELGKEANEPTWINVELALNASFALIFAGVGAALGMWRKSKERDAGGADDQS